MIRHLEHTPPWTWCGVAVASVLRTSQLADVDCVACRRAFARERERRIDEEWRNVQDTQPLDEEPEP